MAYPILSETLDKSQYEKYHRKKVSFKGRIVEVRVYEGPSNRQGSYERGLKWSSTRYGTLRRNVTKNNATVSVDHGKTWHRTPYWMYEPEKYALSKTPKGRVRLGTNVEKEFAFDAIQKINREWEGPGYRWHK
jgi:hypothetical protein